MEEKLSGSFYTPYETVNFIYKYLLEQNKIFNTILEPSAGDGRFLDLFINLSNVDSIVGVELYESKTRELVRKNYPNKIKIINSDFLLFSKNFTEKFQLIIGNPPYISIKNMDKSFLDVGRELCNDNELPKNLMQNSWVAFILASISLLEDNGAIFLFCQLNFYRFNMQKDSEDFLKRSLILYIYFLFMKECFQILNKRLVWFTSLTKKKHFHTSLIDNMKN